MQTGWNTATGAPEAVDKKETMHENRVCREISTRPGR